MNKEVEMSKKVMVGFKLEPEAKKKFEEICRNDYTTLSQKLYAYVHTTIKHSGKRISLEEFRERKIN